MTDKNDALFLVRLPFGQKTIPYQEVPELIAMAKSPGYDGEHEAVMLALDICHEEGPLRAAVQAGEVEVLDKSLHRMTQPFNGRLKDTVLTVQALREYVESIKGLLEVEDAPAAKVEAGTGAKPSGDDIPGKMPRTTIGKLAITAAWEIEGKAGKQASANQVIAKLVEWIKTEPILLEKTPHGIRWMTTNTTEADFSIEACGKALAKWNLTRP